MSQASYYPSYMDINLWHVATIYQSSHIINHVLLKQYHSCTMKSHVSIEIIVASEQDTAHILVLFSV